MGVKMPSRSLSGILGVTGSMKFNPLQSKKKKKNYKVISKQPKLTNLLYHYKRINRNKIQLEKQLKEQQYLIRSHYLKTRTVALSHSTMAYSTL